MWNTTPARQVTAADVVRGVKRTCNPAQPFGGLPDFESLIAGMQAFCDGFAKVDPKSASAIAAYQNSTAALGRRCRPERPQHGRSSLSPARRRTSSRWLSLPAFSPAPAEYDKYIPASADLAAHTISDGPYMVTTYNATQGDRLLPQPGVESRAPTPCARPTSTRLSSTRRVTRPPSSSSCRRTRLAPTWSGTPSRRCQQVTQLIASKDPNFYLGPTFSTNPYIIFNTVSPNNERRCGRWPYAQAISRRRLVAPT